MPNYKISVSKDSKKYTIVMKADSQAIARERVHKEWYSILGLEEVQDKQEIWSTFIFEWHKSWEFKHWKIVWNDIFKSYVKLRKELEYDITLIYSEKDEKLSYYEKMKIIKELKEEYDITFPPVKKDKNQEKQDNQVKKESNSNIDNKLNNFYLKKELDEVNNLLEKVLLKLEQIITWSYLSDINDNKKDKLKVIFNEIIKLKKSTNINKLREIWELALLKIWKIELEEVERLKTKESRELLDETNKLLKKIWSKTHFVEKDKDINYQVKYYFNYIKNSFSDLKVERKKETVDRESHSYVKNLLYLSKYKDFYKENTKLILKNFYKFIFNKELKEELFLSRSVIKQNIVLLKAKEKGVTISYTFLKRGLDKIIESFFKSFVWVSKILFQIILFYIITFILYINFYSFLNYNFLKYDWIFYFIIILFLYILFKSSKNVIILFINFVILFFIIIFGVINF